MSKTPSPDDAHTTLHPSGGIKGRGAARTDSKVNKIDPRQPFPARTGLRYELSPKLMGKLENLAKARFEIRELTDTDLQTWRTDTDEPYWPIAQSVNANSEIEGEQIAADKLTLLFAAATEPRAAYIDDELERRMEAIKSISGTYLWALGRDRAEVVINSVLQKQARLAYHKTQLPEAADSKNNTEFITTRADLITFDFVMEIHQRMFAKT